MRRILQLSTLCLAAGVVSACKPEEVVTTPKQPTAGVRFINAVPDTGATFGLDFRFVDVVENSAAGYVDPLVGGGTKDFAPYVLMIIALMVRPYGIFGKKIIEHQAVGFTTVNGSGSLSAPM